MLTLLVPPHTAVSPLSNGDTFRWPWAVQFQYCEGGMWLDHQFTSTLEAAQLVLSESNKHMDRLKRWRIKAR